RTCRIGVGIKAASHREILGEEFLALPEPLHWSQFYPFLPLIGHVFKHHFPQNHPTLAHILRQLPCRQIVVPVVAIRERRGKVRIQTWAAMLRAPQSSSTWIRGHPSSSVVKPFRSSVGTFQFTYKRRQLCAISTKNSASPEASGPLNCSLKMPAPSTSSAVPGNLPIGTKLLN